MSFSDWGGGGESYQKTNPFAPKTVRSNPQDDQFNQGLQLVTENIKRMTVNYALITNMTQAIGGQQDNEKLRSNLSTKIKETTNLVKDVQISITKLLSLSSVSKEKTQKIDKLGIDFETFNKKFKQLAAVARDKLEEIPIPYRVDFDSDSYRNSVPDDRSHLLLQQQQQHQQQQYLKIESEREFQDTIIRERDEEIKIIQAQMIEVNDIFKDLAKLVDEQSELVDNIETNISIASTNVTEATKDLVKADEHSNTARKRLCIFAVVIAILVVVVVIVVVVVTTNKSKQSSFSISPQ
eukprot:TRINITY_DN3527_c0_g3_i2.p1 TRINITY_DN3527_c0_g3~~TRINITY_DN3527_c0_g3_i2.p1  ORF type:complete len:295 (-),score=70.44 TRINITY_DN3527_c0_g3_i2:120-1004(-)